MIFVKLSADREIMEGFVVDPSDVDVFARFTVCVRDPLLGLKCVLPLYCAVMV